MAPDKKKAEEEELKKKKEEERGKRMKKAEEPYICLVPKKRKPLSKEECHEKCKDYVHSGVLREREIKKSFEEDQTIDTQSLNLPKPMKKQEPLAKLNASPLRRMELTKTELMISKDPKNSSTTTKTDCSSQDTKSINKSNKENWNDAGDSPPYKGTWNPNFQCEDFMKLNQRRILYGCDDELQNQFDSERSPDKKMKTIPNDEKCKNLTNLSEVKNEESKNENEGTKMVEGNKINNCPKIEVKIKKKKGDIEQTSNKAESKLENKGIDETNKDEPNEFKCEELINDVESKQRNEGVDKTNEDEPNEFKCEELIDDKSKKGNEGVDKTNEDKPNEFQCEELIDDKSEPGNEKVDETNKDASKEFECCQFEPGSTNLRKSSSEGKQNEFDCDDASASDSPSMESLNRICEDVKSSSNLPLKYPSIGDIVKMCERVSSTNAGLKSSSKKLSQSCDNDLKETKNANRKDEQTRTTYFRNLPVVCERSPDKKMETIPDDEKCQNLTKLSEDKNEKLNNESEKTKIEGNQKIDDIEQNKTLCGERDNNGSYRVENEYIRYPPNEKGCMIEVKIRSKKVDVEQTSNKKPDQEQREFECEGPIDNESKEGNEGVDKTNKDEPNEFKCEELIDDKSKQGNEGVDKTNEDEPNEFKCEELIADKSEPGNEGVDKTNEDEPNEFKCEELIADKSKQGNEGVDKTNKDEPNEFKCEELIADKSKQGNEGVDKTNEDKPNEFNSEKPMKYPSYDDIVKMLQTCKNSPTNTGLKSSLGKDARSCDNDLEETKNANQEHEQTRTCYSLDGTPVVYNVSADDDSEGIINEDYGNCPELNSQEENGSKQSTTTECHKSEKLICRRSPNLKTNAEKSSPSSTYSTATERYEPQSLKSRRSPNPSTDKNKTRVRDNAKDKMQITGKHVQFSSSAAASTQPEQKVTLKKMTSNQAEKVKKTRDLKLRDICKFNVGMVPENTSNYKIDRSLVTKIEKLSNLAGKPTILKPAREKSYVFPAKYGKDLRSEAVSEKIEEKTIDRNEQNINCAEQNINRAEQYINHVEQNINRVEQNINRVEQDINRAEQNISCAKQNIKQSIDNRIINAPTRDKCGMSTPVTDRAIYSNYETPTETNVITDSLKCIDLDQLAGRILEGYLKQYSPTDVCNVPSEYPNRKSSLRYQDGAESWPEMEPIGEGSQYDLAGSVPMSENLVSLSDDNFEDETFDSNANVSGFTSPMEIPVKEDLGASSNSQNASRHENSISPYPDSISALDNSKRIDILKSQVRKTKIVWRQITRGLRKGEKACVIDWKKQPLIPVKENKATRVSKAYKEKNSLFSSRKRNP